MSGGYSKNFVPDKSTFRQDTAPVNPSGGDIWIDTSGNNVETNFYAETKGTWELLTARGPDVPAYPVEGSLWRDTNAQALKQYDGSNFKKIGNAIDKTTITENAQGEIQVSRPLTIVEGRFNSSFDNWTVDEGSGGATVSRDDTLSYEGSHSAFLQASSSSSDNAEIRKEINLTGATEVSVFVYDDNSAYRTGIEINGEYIQASNPDTWEQLSINVGELEGIYTVRLRCEYSLSPEQGHVDLLKVNYQNKRDSTDIGV